jgi:hypothetical protein
MKQTNTSILQGDAGAIANSNLLAEDIIQTNPAYGYSDALGIVTLTYTSFIARLTGNYYTVTAGNIALNAGALANPTTHYVYVQLVLGVATVTVSTVDPDTVLASGYATMQIARFKSVANVITYQYTINTSTEAYRLEHQLGDYSSRYTRPVWLTGVVLSTAGGGVLSTTAGKCRRILREIVIAAVNAGTIILDDEVTTAAGLNNITTYVGGGAITAGKYHKLLIGIVASADATYKLIAMRQSTPTVEYATKAAANADAEFKAATGFPSGYKPAVLPIAYYTMLKGDYTDFTNVDIRESGIIGAGGGAAGAADHGLLAGLADDDHAQYALLAGRAGSQTLYGGTAADEDLNLISTFNANRGDVVIGGDGAANRQRVDEDGFAWMEGTGEAWDDIIIPLENIATGVNAPLTITFGPGGNIKALGFRGTSNINEIFGGVEMVHTYKEGTDISFHVHWGPVDAAVLNVKWNLEYTWANVGAVFGASATTSVVTATAGAAWTHQLSGMLLAGAGKQIGSVIKFRFYRDPTDAQDTYTSNAAITSIGVHYRKDSHGSRLISTK